MLLPHRPKLLLVPLILAGACHSPYTRTSRSLGSIGSLVYSNSPVVIEEREPVQTEAGPEARYTVLVANYGSLPVTVALSQVEATTDDQPGTALASCRMGAHAVRADVALAPGGRARVECRLSLTPAGVARLAHGDVDIRFRIPLHAPEGEAELRFAYALQMEDGE